MQAWPEGQSASVTQPHLLLTQAVPSLISVQSTHAPVEPHASASVPGWQTVPLQQPPVHASPPAQLAPHTPVAGSHA
jgi:hypothetical protein